MATHCSTRDPSRLSPPHGATRLREEPMNTTVLSVVVIGELAKLAGYEWLWIGRQTWIETLGVLTS